MIRTLLLDLDGTLVHSVPDLAAALNRLMRARGLAEFSHPETAAMVGDGVAKLVERAFAARGRSADTGAVAEFSADYGAHAAVAQAPYPGVAEGLDALAAEGWRLAVCTNKPERRGAFAAGRAGARAVFRRRWRRRQLSGAQAGPGASAGYPVSGWRQPSARSWRGDHANDVAAARGAGVPCIFAAWGYGPAAMGEGSADVAEDFSQLAAIARRLLT